MYDKTFDGSVEELYELFKTQDLQLCQFLLKPTVTSGSTNRTKDNIISTSMMVFDFDKGLVTSRELLQVFKNYKFIMRQSSSWTKEKEKVHLYLPFKYTLNLNHEEFKRLYKNVCLKFGLQDVYDDSMTKSVQPAYELKDREQYINEVENYFDPRCCIDGSNQARNTVDTYGKVNPKNRVIRYLDAMLKDLYEGNREKAVNAFIYRFEQEAENKPSRSDMEEAYTIIKREIGDSKWIKENDAKFTKRINQNFQ